MSPDNNQINKIIARNLAGEASEKEEKILKDWILESDENYLTYKILRESSDSGYRESKLLITDKSFEKAWNQSRNTGEVSYLGVGYKVFKGLMVSAASLLLILVSVFTYRQVVRNEALQEAGNEPTVIEKFSPSGQKTKIFLPDGSSVWLNADSKLQYRSDFNEKFRTVSLTGEAYFDVKEDPSKPFQVKSGNLAIKAYGTSFNINTFYGHQKVEVVLEKGELLIENLFTSLRPGMPLKTDLEPGERALYSLKDAELDVETVDDTYDYTCWIDGVLSFRHDDFETAINKLEKWYGVNFVWSEEPEGDWYFTGEFSNEYLDNVLKVMVNSEGIRYRMKDQSIQLIFPENKQ